MANVKFNINGKILENVTDDFALTYTLDLETGTTVASAGTEILLGGEECDDIIETFYSDCEGRGRRLPVTIQPACTDPLEDFEVRPDGVTYCPGQELAVNVSKREGSCISEMLETVIWKEGFLEAAQAGEIRIPKIFYCVQKGTFLTLVLFNIRVIVLLVIGVLQAIRIVLEGLTLGGLPNDIFPTSGDYDNALSGCGRYNHAPLVKDIIAYHVERCGFEFKSSILVDDPVYQNTALYEAAIEKGIYHEDDVNYSERNSNNLTVRQLLEGLKEVFNADYRLIDGVFYFEREDYFDTRRNVRLEDLSKVYPERAEDAPCYTIDTSTAFAYWRGEFAKDRFDSQGNRLITRNYADIVEWNDPPQPIGEEWQKGELARRPPFGGVRAMFDTLTCGKDDGEDNVDWNLDNFRDGGFTATTGLKRTRALITGSHAIEAPKLIVLEPGFRYNDANIIRRRANSRANKQCYDYNYPLYFNEEYEIPELYQSFHYIDNPRGTPKRDYYLATNVSYVPEDFCASAKLINERFSDLYVDTPLGRGYPEEIQVDFDRCIITLSNIRISC